MRLQSGLGYKQIAKLQGQLADMLGVSDKTIRRLIARRLLRSSHALRHLLIPKKEIERFLEQTTSK
jgi:excisionase family DNA binding protein